MHPTRGHTSYADQEDTARDDETREAELLHRMAQGDENALGALYDRWRTVVFRVAARIVGDEHDAEEVLEDTFWQAWRQAARYDVSRGTVGSWLVTIARSRALERARTQLRRTEASTGTPAPPPVAAETADEPVERSDERDRVRRALAQLPAEQRQALEMAYFEGLSQSEVAERTGLPLGTVKTRMRLALRKLRDELAILREEAR